MGEELTPSPNELSLVVQAMFSWHPEATLSAGIAGWESKEEICPECNCRRGKKNAHSRFKITLATWDVSIGRVARTSTNDSKHFVKWNSQMMSELRLLQQNRKRRKVETKKKGKRRITPFDREGLGA